MWNNKKIRQMESQLEHLRESNNMIKNELVAIKKQQTASEETRVMTLNNQIGALWEACGCGGGRDE